MKKKILAIIGAVIVISVAVIIGIKVKTDNTETEDTTEEVVVEKTDAITAESDETTKESYIITFVDSITDEAFKEIKVEAGTSVEELPEAPEHDGYEFTEYDGNYSNVTSDETVVALYEEVYSDTSSGADSSKGQGSSDDWLFDAIDDPELDVDNYVDAELQGEGHTYTDEEIKADNEIYFPDGNLPNIQ